MFHFIRIETLKTVLHRSLRPNFILPIRQWRGINKSSQRMLQWHVPKKSVEAILRTPPSASLRLRPQQNGLI